MIEERRVSGATLYACNYDDIVLEILDLEPKIEGRILRFVPKSEPRPSNNEESGGAPLSEVDANTRVGIKTKTKTVQTEVKTGLRLSTTFESHTDVKIANANATTDSEGNERKKVTFETDASIATRSRQTSVSTSILNASPERCGTLKSKSEHDWFTDV